MEVPFIRPEELSGDTATSIEVLNHSIESVAERYEYIVLLQPTSPLRSTSDIDTAIEMLNDGIQAIVSVCEAEHSPKWMNTLPEDHSMENFLADQSKNKRSQDLGSYYRLNGAIYVAEIDYFNDNKGFFGDATKAYIMPRARSIDIDSQEDLDYAAFLISKKRKA